MPYVIKHKDKIIYELVDMDFELAKRATIAHAKALRGYTFRLDHTDNKNSAMDYGMAYFPRPTKSFNYTKPNEYNKFHKENKKMWLVK